MLLKQIPLREKWSGVACRLRSVNYSDYWNIFKYQKKFIIQYIYSLSLRIFYLMIFFISFSKYFLYLMNFFFCMIKLFIILKIFFLFFLLQQIFFYFMNFLFFPFFFYSNHKVISPLFSFPVMIPAPIPCKLYVIHPLF